MTAADVPPEIPPLHPGQPAPRPGGPTPSPAPVFVPSTIITADDSPTDARGALLGQRRVLLTGPLDDTAVTRASAELMMLDGTSEQPVELIVNSDGGSLPAALAVLDVVDLMRAPVVTRCVGRAMGTAAVVLAAGTGGRAAAGHAMVGLRLADEHDVSGHAGEIERFLAQLEHARTRVVALLARVTRMDADAVARELDEGTPMGAEQARERGIIDEVVTRAAPRVSPMRRG